MPTLIASYPNYAEQMKELVAQHRELVEEPLLLAIYYSPGRDENDVFLFEVLDNFNGASIETDGDLLEVLYGSTPHFDLHDRDARLHIVLTSPEELLKAAANGTKRFQEVKQALADHRSQIIYGDLNQVKLNKVFQ